MPGEVLRAVEGGGPLGTALFEPTLGFDEMVRQCNEVLEAKEKLIAESKDAPKTRKLLEHVARLAETVKVLQADRWKPDYIKQFTQCQLAIREEGIIDQCPDRLWKGGSQLPPLLEEMKADTKTAPNLKAAVNCESDEDDGWDDEPKKKAGGGKEPDPNIYTLIDKYGVPFDSLRDKTGPAQRFYDWLDKNKGNSQILREYFGEQATDSWTSLTQSVKWILVTNRDEPLEKYRWKPDDKAAKQRFEHESAKRGDALIKSVIAQHAFTYEFLRKTALPNCSQDLQLTYLIRSENAQDTLRPNGLELNKAGPLKRGAAESYSLIDGAYPYGKETTVTCVPFSRCFGVYAHSKPRRVIRQDDRFAKFMQANDAMDEKDPEGLFLNDHENEVVAMTEGCDTTWVGTELSAKDIPPPPWEKI